MTQDVNAEQSKEPMNQYYKLELGEVFSRIHSFDNLRLQIGTFIGTAHMTALAVGLSTEKAGVIFMAVATLIVLIVADFRARRQLATYCYRGLQLQKEFAPDDDETFLHIVPGRMIQKVREVSQLANRQSRQAALGRIPISSPSIMGFWIPLSVAILETTTGFSLWLAFDWSLF